MILVLSVATVIGTLVSDILLAWLDPDTIPMRRVKYDRY